MIIKSKTDILCIRFVNIGKYNCIEEHQNIIDKNGYVWFGKIGTRPANAKVENILGDDIGLLLLKEPKSAFFAYFDKFSIEQPQEGRFPEYYNTEILENRNISMWFRIKDIMKIDDISILNNVVLKNGRSPILETAKKSMSPHFFTVTKCDIEI